MFSSSTSIFPCQYIILPMLHTHIWFTYRRCVVLATDSVKKSISHIYVYMNFVFNWGPEWQLWPSYPERSQGDPINTLRYWQRRRWINHTHTLTHTHIEDYVFMCRTYSSWIVLVSPTDGSGNFLYFKPCLSILDNMRLLNRPLNLRHLLSADYGNHYHE